MSSKKSINPLHLVPVTRIEFRRIKGRGDGWWKDNGETVFGVFRKNLYTMRTRVRSRYRPTQVKIHPSRMGGRDGRRDPDSGLGFTLHFRSQWRTVDEERGAEGRPVCDRIPEITGIRRNSQWDFPRRRALFTSDGTNSMTSESDTPEGYADRPPELEHLERRMREKRQDEGGTERLVSPHMTLERAVIQLQKDLDNCRTEFEITRKLTPAVNRRQPRQAGFTSTPVPRYSG